MGGSLQPNPESTFPTSLRFLHGFQTGECASMVAKGSDPSRTICPAKFMCVCCSLKVLVFSRGPKRFKNIFKHSKMNSTLHPNYPPRFYLQRPGSYFTSKHNTYTYIHIHFSACFTHIYTYIYIYDLCRILLTPSIAKIMLTGRAYGSLRRMLFLMRRSLRMRFRRTRISKNALKT